MTSRGWRVVFAVVGVAVACEVARVGAQPSKGEQEIRAAVKQIVAAYAANDVEKYFSFYAPDMTVLRATGRWTTQGYHDRWKQIVGSGGGVASADVVDLQPKAVHIMAGTNDIAGNTGPMTHRQSQDNLRMMTEIAQAAGIHVLLASIPPSAAFPWRPGLAVTEPIRALNRWIEDYAKRAGATWIDYTPALATAAGGMKPGMAVDGVHPTAEGYAAMERVLGPVVRRFDVV